MRTDCIAELLPSTTGTADGNGWQSITRIHIWNIPKRRNSLVTHTSSKPIESTILLDSRKGEEVQLKQTFLHIMARENLLLPGARDANFH